MPQYGKIIVYAEKTAAELMETFPALTKIATSPGAGLTFVAASTGLLKEAKAWLASRGHKHEVHEPSA